MVLEIVLILFFYMKLSSLQASFIEETIFSPLYILVSFVIDKVNIGGYVSLWICLLIHFPVSLYESCLHSSSHIMRNAGLDEAQAGIKIAGKNINNHRNADDTIPMAEREELSTIYVRECSAYVFLQRFL